ncbi:MAG TPA: lactate utilization protein [Ktedonobacteraceae bacterium]|nr:lactate utilization protein [Ktedonobacteraceae bacterium]
METQTTTDLFQRFQQRLEAAGGEAHSTENLAGAADIIAAHPALARREIVVPPAFAAHQPWGAILPILIERGITIHEAGDPASVADFPAGLSSAELAIAETGSIMLAENALPARIVSMLTLTHFALVQASTLYPMLEAAGQTLQQLTQPGPGQRHYISLVTGPSRTADIERTLTIGVQGPRALCVIIVG